MHKIIGIIIFAIALCVPSVSFAESTKASGISTHSNGRFQIVSNATTLRTGTFYFPGVIYGTSTYNVTVTTSGYAPTNGWQYYSDAELLTAATYVYDTGMGAFFSQTGTTWTHDPGCGNTHTFTRTLVPPPVVVIPTGGDTICPAAFHIINTTQTRAEHMAECQALGGGSAGWDLAEVTSSNASSINANIGGTAIVANRVVSVSDYEYPFKCQSEAETWPEPGKTLRYNGTCFDDIPDSTPYDRALCIDSTPLCNPAAGVCGTELNQCTIGTYAHVPDSTEQYLWQCVGVDEGGNTNCAVDRDVDDVTTTSGSFAPVCRLTSSNIVGLGQTLVWAVQGLGSSSANFSFDWSSYPNLVRGNFASASLTSTTPITVTTGAINVAITGEGSTTSISCPAGKIMDNEIEISLDKPIVENDQEECRLTWSGVDTGGAVCGLYDEQNELVHTISTESGNRGVSPTHKYVLRCSYSDATGVPMDSIQSEYVSCIKKGELIEI